MSTFDATQNFKKVSFLGPNFVKKSVFFTLLVITYIEGNPEILHFYCPKSRIFGLKLRVLRTFLHLASVEVEITQKFHDFQTGYTHWLKPSRL